MRPGLVSWGQRQARGDDAGVALVEEIGDELGPELCARLRDVSHSKRHFNCSVGSRGAQYWVLAGLLLVEEVQRVLHRRSVSANKNCLAAGPLRQRHTAADSSRGVVRVGLGSVAGPGSFATIRVHGQGRTSSVQATTKGIDMVFVDPPNFEGLVLDPDEDGEIRIARPGDELLRPGAVVGPVDVDHVISRATHTPTTVTTSDLEVLVGSVSEDDRSARKALQAWIRQYEPVGLDYKAMRRHGAIRLTVDPRPGIDPGKVASDLVKIFEQLPEAPTYTVTLPSIEGELSLVFEPEHGEAVALLETFDGDEVTLLEAGTTVSAIVDYALS